MTGNYRVDRQRHFDLEDMVDRFDPSSDSGTLGRLATTTTVTTYPTSAQSSAMWLTGLTAVVGQVAAAQLGLADIAVLVDVVLAASDVGPDQVFCLHHAGSLLSETGRSGDDPPAGEPDDSAAAPRQRFVVRLFVGRAVNPHWRQCDVLQHGHMGKQVE